MKARFELDNSDCNFFQQSKKKAKLKKERSGD